MLDHSCSSLVETLRLCTPMFCASFLLAPIQFLSKTCFMQEDFLNISKIIFPTIMVIQKKAKFQQWCFHSLVKKKIFVGGMHVAAYWIAITCHRGSQRVAHLASQLPFGFYKIWVLGKTWGRYTEITQCHTCPRSYIPPSLGPGRQRWVSWPHITKGVHNFTFTLCMLKSLVARKTSILPQESPGTQIPSLSLSPQDS